MTAEGVGVNHDSPVPESNKPPRDTAVTGQPDNATQRAKQIGLTHTRRPLLIMPLAITKQMTAGPTGTTDFTFLACSHLHYHHLSPVVWQPNILLGVWFVCYVCTSQNKRKLHSHISVYGPPHRFLLLSMLASSSGDKLSS